MIELEIWADHIHRGARGRMSGWPENDWPAHDEAMVRFPGGARANATLFGEVLHVFPYRDASGALVAAQSWRIRPTPLGFRVEGRVAAA